VGKEMLERKREGGEREDIERGVEAFMAVMDVNQVRAHYPGIREIFSSFYLLFLFCYILIFISFFSGWNYRGFYDGHGREDQVYEPPHYTGIREIFFRFGF
jgi:hypothetical protein